MQQSRAGLGNTSSVFRSVHTVAAVLPFLLLLLTFSTTVVQAAPLVPPSPHSVTTFKSAQAIPPHARYSYGMSASDSSTQSVFLEDAAHPRLAHPHPLSTHREPSATPNREVEAETVTLVRRKSIAAKIRAAFHKLGHKIKKGFQKVGHAIKKGFQKVGHAIKHAAQKVGHFIKTTGKKIAKVGLKIAATVGKIAGKVVGFIPGAKGIGKAMEGASEGMNKASDAIHAHIGGKLGKAMKRMDKAQKIVGYIP